MRARSRRKPRRQLDTMSILVQDSTDAVPTSDENGGEVIRGVRGLERLTNAVTALCTNVKSLFVVPVNNTVAALAIALMVCLIAPTQSAFCGCEHRYDVLMEFFNATNGPGWRFRTSWGTLSPCSSITWYGVVCSGGDITGISLYGNSLRGTLPSSLGNLSNLQRLSLYSNSLSGTLPPSWSGMVSLGTLCVYSTQLSGNLPPSWGGLTALTVLALQANQLNGTLPAAWSSMAALQTLYLFSNSLVGPLPPSWGALTNLSQVGLYANSLNGSLPEEWGNITRLQLMYAYGNHFTGSLPSSWGAMASLQQLFLQSNQITGTLPPAWARLGPTLTNMYLYANLLSGTLPEDWSKLSSLQELDLATNRLRGPLPFSWANMSSLQMLNIMNNQLSGTLPWAWGAWTNMKNLYMNNNSCLGGSVPESWASIASVNMCATQIWPRSQANAKVCADNTNSTCAGPTPSYTSTPSTNSVFSSVTQHSYAPTSTYSPSRSRIYTPTATAGVSMTYAASYSTTLSQDRLTQSASWQLRTTPSSTLVVASLSATDRLSRSAELSISAPSVSVSHAMRTETMTITSKLSTTLTATKSPSVTATVRRGVEGAHVSWTLSNRLPLTETHTTATLASISTSLFLSATSMATITRPTFSETIPLPLRLTAVVSTARYTAQVASRVGSVVSSLAASPSVGLDLQRIGTLTAFGRCDNGERQTMQDVLGADIPSVLDAPLQLQLGSGSTGGALRGTVVGNVVTLLLLICAAAIATSLRLLHQCRRLRRRSGSSAWHSLRPSLLRCAAALRLPGLLIVGVALLWDSIVSSSTTLVAYGSVGGDDSVTNEVVGAAGLALTVSLGSVLVVVIDPRPAAFRAVPVRPLPLDVITPRSRREAKMRGLWSSITRPANEWEPRHVGSDANFVDHFGHLFESCRAGRHWWLLVDVLTTVVVSVFNGVVAESVGECQSVAWSALGVCVASLTARAWLRPFSTDIEAISDGLLAVTQVAVLSCNIAGASDIGDVLAMAMSVVSLLLSSFPLLIGLQSRWRKLATMNDAAHVAEYHQAAMKDASVTYRLDACFSGDTMISPSSLLVNVLICRG